MNNALLSGPIKSTSGLLSWAPVWQRIWDSPHRVCLDRHLRGGRMQAPKVAEIMLNFPCSRSNAGWKHRRHPGLF